LWAEPLSALFFQFHKNGGSEGHMDYEKAREAVKEALAGRWKRVYDVFNAFLEGDVKHFTRMPGWDEVFEPVAKMTVFTMSMMPLSVNSSVYAPFTDNVTFYDVAEGLMAMYTFGRFDTQYMPRARLQTGKRISLRRVKKFLEGLGIFRNFRGNAVLTGVGQMLAKALIYGATSRSTVVESVYVSSFVAYTLHAEMRQFNEESVKMFLLETIVRYRRISAAVREWMKSAPKLYLRELPLFYDWQDAAKDMALVLAEKKEDFRFTI
jgi:hypothetical protein